MAEVEAKVPEDKLADVPASESAVEDTVAETVIPPSVETTAPAAESKDVVSESNEETPAVAATEVVPEPETKPAATPNPTLFHKLRGKFLRPDKLKVKVVAVKEELQPSAVESASVPEAKPVKKVNIAVLLSKVKKSIWQKREAKSGESTAAPVEEAPKLPETVESSTPATEEVITEPVITEPVSTEEAAVNPPITEPVAEPIAEPIPETVSPEAAPMEAAENEKAPEPVEATATEPAPTTSVPQKSNFTVLFQKFVKRITNKSPSASSAAAEESAKEATSAPAEETSSAPAEETASSTPAEEPTSKPTEEMALAPPAEESASPATVSEPVAAEPPATST